MAEPNPTAVLFYRLIYILTSAKDAVVFLFVGLFVCLSVSRITQTVRGEF